MTLSYVLQARTPDGAEITGRVEIDPAPETTAPLLFRIDKCRVQCGADRMEGAGLLRIGFIPDGTPNESGADWELADWRSYGFGVRFLKNADTPLPAAEYSTLPPRIELCTDNLSGGICAVDGSIVLTKPDVLLPPSSRDLRSGP